MPKVNEIENAWFVFVKAAIAQDFPNHNVIFSEQDGERPSKPYVTLKINGPFRVTTTDAKVFHEPSGKFRQAGHRRYTMSIQSYGLDNLDVLDDIILGTQNPEFTPILKGCDIGIENRGNVIDISTTISTAWEKRGSLDIAFLSSKIKLTNIGIIETAELDGEINKDNGEKVIIDKFTVPEP